MATGDLYATDVDNSDRCLAPAVTTATATSGGYGTYTISCRSGLWSYSLNQSQLLLFIELN